MKLHQKDELLSCRGGWGEKYKIIFYLIIACYVIFYYYYLPGHALGLILMLVCGSVLLPPSEILRDSRILSKMVTGRCCCNIGSNKS